MAEEGTLLNLDLNQDLTLDTFSEGDEVELQIRDMRTHISDKGNQSIRVVLDSPEDSNIDDIYHYLSLPGEDDDPKTTKKKLKRIKDFFDAFGIPYDDAIDYEEAKGLTGVVIVGEEEDNRGEMRNTVRKLVSKA